MTYAVFFIFALICEILGTIAGFGSSVLFVPLLNFFMPSPVVMALTSILHNFSNIAKIGMFRKTINYRLLFLFGIPSLLLTIVGAVLTAHVKTVYIEMILAVFLVFFSLLFLLRPLLILPANAINAISTGSLAGFFAGFTGTGGAIRGIGLTAFDLEKDFFVGTSAAIDFGVDFSRFFIYLKNGFLQQQYYWYIPLLFIASFLGSWIGKLLLARINQRVFKKMVLIFILLIGLSMLYKLLFIKS
jgi:uncharacterized membrane protein YfcA